MLRADEKCRLRATWPSIRQRAKARKQNSPGSAGGQRIHIEYATAEAVATTFIQKKRRRKIGGVR